MDAGLPEDLVRDYQAAVAAWRAATDRLGAAAPDASMGSGATRDAAMAALSRPKSGARPEGSYAERRAAEMRAIEASVHRLLRGEPEPAADTDTEAGDAPVRPWSATDFADRVATFRVHTWFGKPASIGPLQCARRGWRNTGPDTISCSACGASVVFGADAGGSRLGPGAASAPGVGQRLADAFVDRLASAHDDLCPWRVSASPEAFASFRPVPSGGLAASFAARAQRVQARLGDAGAAAAVPAGEAGASAAGPILKELQAVLFPAETPLAKAVRAAADGGSIADLAALVRRGCDVDAAGRDRGGGGAAYAGAALLALCGWDAEAGAGLRCGCCRAEVTAAPAGSKGRKRPREAPSVLDRVQEACRKALGALRRAKRARAGPGAVDDAAAAGEATDDGQGWDPAAGHRWFCPWHAPQASLPELPGPVEAAGDEADGGGGIVERVLRPVAGAERRLTERALALLEEARAGRGEAEGGDRPAAVPGWLALLVALLLVVSP